ncbi:hypothetical protein KsCSTR_34480 [Candidatus Kuenenia stuttgartiensis]|uniref:Uncharacterized protein n=1 Tax=Kuenenia stuttgartiensis TaxID=174633 RepID=A0A6G7GUD8_KUEST|nr:hypothetical protein KsCSTR_34480 [Candidatus Kuenenia stuttgartiensis]
MDLTYGVKKSKMLKSSLSLYCLLLKRQVSGLYARYSGTYFSYLTGKTIALHLTLVGKTPQ